MFFYSEIPTLINIIKIIVSNINLSNSPPFPLKTGALMLTSCQFVDFYLKFKISNSIT